MVVQHNISAMTANRYYTNNNSALGKSLEKLSSGLAINRAGDNAAGLAVSEKMRAQISGMTQASKNAQDGISMVQTFEGALQETDSILQRMRTLAVQSANGSYANEVDRDAIQLEFDQLNDELNQIADTDYNGVVVLNGGQMADGLKAVNNKFDYANKKTQVMDSVRTAFSQAVDDAANKVANLEAKRELGAYDLTAKDEVEGTFAPEWNTVDNSGYGKTQADSLWKALHLDTKGDGNGEADLTKATEVAVTFKYTVDEDGNGEWAADSATAKVGDNETAIESDLLDALVVTSTANDATGDAAISGTGGFTVGAAENGKEWGNAIFDEKTNVTNGSTVTLVYKNNKLSKMAPTNIGYNESSLTLTPKTSESFTVIDPNAPTSVSLDASLKDSVMTQAVNDALTGMEDQNVSIEYNCDLNTENGTKQDSVVKIGNQTLTAADADADYTEFTGTGGKKFYAKLTVSSGVPTITFAAGKSKDSQKLASIVGDAAANKKAGTINLKLSISEHKFEDNTSLIKITPGDDPNLESSATLTSKIDAAKVDLQTAKNKLAEFDKLDMDDEVDWEKVKTMFAETQSSSGSAVSISDSFDNSKAKMTYAEDMSLQVGARTKDIVNFKFSYSSDDLGGLEKNMNCSARDGGLETAKLSLRTQEEANDAIDRIDKALNKVSMVRATFGAIQNRLEHKINNLDTNAENVTAAESRIRDTQMDQEMMKFTSAQILSQASQSMLAQANSLPQGVLQLLG